MRFPTSVIINLNHSKLGTHGVANRVRVAIATFSLMTPARDLPMTIAVSFTNRVLVHMRIGYHLRPTMQPDWLNAAAICNLNLSNSVS